MTDTGIEPQSKFELPGLAKKRCEAQELIWNQVWRRRFIYFITVFASLYLVAYPLSRVIPRASEYVTGLSLVSGAIRALGQVLPGALTLWLDAYARDPEHFLLVAFLVGLLILLGVQLGGIITDIMEHVWHNTAPSPASKLGIIAKVCGGTIALYVIGNAYLPKWLPAPEALQEFLTAHISTSVIIILAATLAALFTPTVCLPPAFVVDVQALDPCA